MKLALGTVQFGLDYGINNTMGKIPEQEVFEILRFAIEHRIDMLDTAYEYGDSEKVIGKFIRSNNADYKVVSKLSSRKLGEAEKSFYESLDNLGLDRIYGYLIHDVKSFVEKPGIWGCVTELREQGKVEKIGFSLYYPREVEYLLEKGIHLDIIQIPFSIFDQRFSDILPSIKAEKIEVHARSVFLQGLGFKNPDELKGDFVKIRDKLLLLRALSKETNIPLSAMFVNFTVLNDFIDKVVIGVDGIEHLKENIETLRYQDKVKNIYAKLMSLRENNENITLPVNWPLSKGSV